MEETNNILRYGKIIQKRRQELGLTQEQLAENISLSQAFVNKLERGAADVTAMKLRNFTALLEQLNWTAGEFAEATDINIAPVLKNSGGRLAKKEDKLAVVTEATVFSVPESISSIEGAKPTGLSFLHTSAYKAIVELYLCPDNSMATGDPASLHAGDILHVHTTERTLVDTKLYFIKFDKKYLVRRVRAIDKRLWFLSDSVQSLPIKAADAEIVGQVVAWTRTYQA